MNAYAQRITLAESMGWHHIQDDEWGPPRGLRPGETFAPGCVFTEIPEIPKGAMDARGEFVVPDGICLTCDGDGKVHSHNPICWTCHGTGHLTLRPHEPGHPDYPRILANRFDPSI